jgi:membrane-bound ClpP family serine protease
MSNEVIWPLVCVVLGLLLVLLEAFIPSGGLIGLLAAGLIIYGLVLAFWQSSALGLRFLLGLGVALPCVLSIALYFWPRSPMAKYFALAPPATDEIHDERNDLAHLVGQFGRSLTPLRPAGVVNFEGRRLDGQALDGLIAAGTLVEAVEVRGRRLIVKAARHAAPASFDESTDPDEITEFPT